MNDDMFERHRRTRGERVTSEAQVLSLDEASDLVGDDIGYWLDNPFMDREALAQKVCWWVTRAAMTEGGLAQSRQVWAVVHDSDTPFMDGTHPPCRMAEQSQEQAERNIAVVEARSARAPKRNLRIETRFVTEWKPA